MNVELRFDYQLSHESTLLYWERKRLGGGSSKFVNISIALMHETAISIWKYGYFSIYLYIENIY